MKSLLIHCYRAAILRYNRYVAMPAARHKFQNLDILDSFASIQYIIDHRCSVSRYGDGEFTLFWGGYKGYQKNDANLSAALIRVLQNTDAPNHIIGIPYYLKSTRGCVQGTKDFWGFFVMRSGSRIRPCLPTNRKYIDTQISRFWIEWKDKDRCRRQLAMLKKIWDGQDVIIVEGTQSRTGVGNDLYANTRSIRRILGPATNAFTQYDKMLDAIVKHADKQSLILLSFGPTATILAYDLAKLGYWAIDIGHLDIEYEWMRMNATEAIPVQSKYTNEAQATGGHNVSDCADEAYRQQIICDITKE